MPLPHILTPNEIAYANDVNDNFAFVMSIIGSLSEPGRQRSLSEFQFGVRQNSLLTAAQDTGAEDYRFLQLGYNADWNLSGGRWKFKRYDSGWASSALRLGVGYAELWLTSATSGNLDAQMNNVFSIRATPADDYMYVAKSLSIQHVDRAAEGIEDYRLTKVFLDTPKMIYENASLKKGIDVFTASNYGVPTHAKAITLTTSVTTTDGELRMYQERGVRHWKYGFISRYGGNGDVQLGEGSHSGKFVIERTGTISSASVYISSYYL